MAVTGLGLTSHQVTCVFWLKILPCDQDYGLLRQSMMQSGRMKPMFSRNYREEVLLVPEDQGGKFT